MGLGLGLRRRGASERIQRAAWLAFGLTLAQVAVGAIMVLAILPPGWRALHAALGAGVWVAVVYLVWLAVRRSQLSRSGGQEAGLPV